MSKPIVICISGDYRSGKSGVAKQLAENLGLAHYSMRTINNCESYFNRSFIDWDKKFNNSTDDVIDDKILEFARNGDCILDFRFAALICKKYNIPYIGVWITADLKARCEGNSDCWEIPLLETEKIILNREKKEHKISLNRYQQDYTDKSLYTYYLDLTKYWYPINELKNRGLETKLLVERLSEKIRNHNLI